MATSSPAPGNELRKENVRDLRPLSAMQEGMLYHALREPTSPAYIEQVCCRIRGAVDVARIEKAWNLLIARHDALRSVFVPAKAAQPLQMVLRERRLALRFEDLRSLEPVAQNARLEEYRDADRITPFDLTRDPLIRVALFQTAPEDFRMFRTNHHIILDGWSLGILMEELLAIYTGTGAAGLAAPEPPERFAEWSSLRDVTEARDWWGDLLDGYEDPCEFPRDPLAQGKDELQVLAFEMSEASSDALRDCAANAGVTLNTLIQSAWGVLLARACNRNDAVFGMTVSGRPGNFPASERMVGLFINTVPLRVRFTEEETVTSLLTRVQKQILRGEQFHFLPLAEIQDTSQPRARLLNHVVTFENYPVGDAFRSNRGMQVAGLHITQEASHERTHYALSVAIEPNARLRFRFRYIDSAYSRSQMERVAEGLTALLESLRPEVHIAELNLIGPRAAAELAAFQQGPAIAVPQGRTLAELFEDAAQAYPNHIAVEDGNGSMTYAELDRRADTIAETIEPSATVAFSLEAGVEMIATILAILKAGSAYVPMDPEWPELRRQFVAAQSATQQHLAYVLFTSGSTGEPKGVAIGQQAVVNLIFGLVAPLLAPLGPALRVALIAPAVFDASVQQIFGALLLGHTLVIPPEATKRDANLLLDWMEERRIDVCDGTPSRFSLLMEAGLAERVRFPVRQWMLGGEALPNAMLREYWEHTHARRVAVVNLYGPTECCVDNSWALLTADRQDSMATASIGKPAANQQLLVLDRNLNQVPPLFAGELCIAGPSLGNGYWGRPDLTSERFVPHPLAEGGRLYRTGDIARWLPDGRLEWMGRADEQVKLRGYRIELAEIEACLRVHPALENAVASVVGDQLAAWYVERQDSHTDITELRNWLRARLPEYMVPSSFVQIGSMPLNSSGKLDRKRLPAPLASAGVPEREANPAERAVRAIWAGVLGRTEIGLREDFFEAGGHSLKAMQVVARLRRELGVTVGLGEFFAAPTIEGLAALLAGRDAARFLHIEPLPSTGDYATSHAQRRLFVLNQLGGAAAYNMPGAVTLTGEVDLPALREALRDVVARHEILRSRLVMRDGEVRQIVGPDDIDFEEVDLGETSAREYVLREAGRPFNLTSDAPVRVRLLRPAGADCVLFFNLHHAAGDGISIGVLSQDLFTAWAARRGECLPLDPLRIQYRDYTAWSNRALSGPAVEAHRRYWHEKLAGEIAALELPADRPRPAKPSFRGGKIRFAIMPGSAASLRALAAEKKTTIFAVLVAGVKALVHRYTGEEDVVIGTPVSGRPHVDLESQIGCYINTLALRDRVHGDMSFAALVEAVRRTLGEALEHAVYPFDLLVDELSLPRDTGRNPLFDVMVILQPPAAPLTAPRGMKVEPFPFDRQVSKFDLTFDFAERNDNSIEAVLEFSSALFERQRIERLASHLVSLLDAAAQDPALSVGRLPILSLQERLALMAAPDEATELSGVSEMLARQPKLATAVIFEDTRLSFGELERLSAGLAGFLSSRGVGRGDVVGVYLERSHWLVVAEFAILRAGAVFLPFSESMPRDRVRFIASDSGMRFLIADEPPSWAEGMETINPRSAIDNPPAAQTDPGDTAYLLYTSGSTGTPKGVAVPHRALLSFAGNLCRNFGFRAGETIYAATRATFDISILELIAAPLNGIAVHVATSRALEDPVCMALEIEMSGAALLQLTPSRLVQLLAEAGDDFLKGIRVLLVGGEAFPAPLAQRLRALPGLDVWNVYGPTETCIWSTAHRLKRDDEGEPLIGRPLPRECVYVLSPQLELQPVGVPGEIAIGGSGLATGYHNNPELTARRFVSPQLARATRMYLTGDRGRWNEDGLLEYLGRTDDQVKLRGYRIEPGEIEHHLLAHPHVEAAACMVRSGELTAYVVAQDGRSELSADLRTHLRRTLPEYMVPVLWVVLDAMPLNPSGKIDRRALPDPHPGMARPGNWNPPRTALEWRAASIFEEVLARGPVGRDADFFDLGGQSLKAMQALARLRRDVASDLTLTDLFAAPTPASLAALAATRKRDPLPAIVRTPDSANGYPLSHAQRRLWVLEQMDPDAAAYSMPAAFVLEGPIDVEALRNAVHALVNHHEILRTVFALEEGEPRQFIELAHSSFESIDLRGLPECESRAAILLDAAAREPFDLARGPLFRCTAYLLGDTHAILGFRMHHIVSDGWSMRVMLRDLLAHYRHIADGTPEPPALKIQYRDYAAWQNALLGSDALALQRAYWHRQLAAPLPVADLPTDFPRPPVQTFRGAEHLFSLDADIAARLRSVARGAGASLFMTLVAGVQVLLHRYSGQTDIVIGTPVAGREHMATEALVGPFLNTLALRGSIDGGMSFRDLLSNVRNTVIAALENQAYPFDLLVDELICERDTSRPAFFDVMVSAGGEDPIDLKTGRLSARAMATESRISKFALSFDFREKEGGTIDAAIAFNRDLFLPERIVRMQRHIELLLRSITENPERAVGALELLPPEERELLITRFNGAAADFNRNGTVIDLFERNVHTHPDNLATTCEGRSWTYRVLDAHANRIAVRMISERNIGPGDIVAICTTRSDWMMAAILAVMKTGAAYLPLDAAYPAERIALLLKASACRLILCEPATDAFEAGVEIWDVAAAASGQAQAPSRRHGPRDLAYVIYTSGSTGTPKGVMVEHRSLANMVWHYMRALAIAPDDRTSIFASISFDSSISEYWPALCAGGSLHFPSRETRESPDALMRWIASARLTLVNTPTSLGEMLLRGPLPDDLAVRTMVVGGERLRPLPRIEYPFRLVNSYGPTEATVDTTWAWLTSEQYSSPNPPIGRPVQNARVYVLDDNLNPAPVGIPGELYVAGEVLARGYLNRPDLTGEKFLPDAFSSDGSRMYATGDRVRWRFDGQLEYLGRTDRQIKVRGYRIEPGEIEAKLLEYPSIAEAAVGTADAGDSPQLVAWLVFQDPEAHGNTQDLRDFLRAALPEFMVPSAFVAMKRLPMTPNGKLDRASLPAPFFRECSRAESVAPRNALEAAIHAAWQAVLGHAEFGVTDNFFDLGGHSLKAMQLTSRLLQTLSLEVPLREIFLAPTVAEQALLAAKKGRSRGRAIDPAPARADYPLSRAQRRLWLMAQMDGASSRYNMPGAYVIDQAVDEVALGRAVRLLLERHEALRTRYVVRDGEPRQVIDADTDMDLPLVDLRDRPEPEAAAREIANADLHQPFDLAHDHLFRCRLLRLGHKRYVLLFTLHHIAGDGWSAQILHEELQAAYAAYQEGREPSLVPLRVQYKDYAWYEHERGFAVEEAWWLDRMRSLPDPVRLPFDFPSEDIADFNGESAGVTLSPAASEQLRRLASARSTTLSNVILTVFFVFLNRLTEQENLALAMTVANRPHRDLETMAGFFVNAVVLRVSVEETKSFEALLDEVASTVAGALEHQQYPLDLLIERLNPPRRGNRQPLFNVVYAFQGFTDIYIRSNPSQSAKSLIAGELGTMARTSKFDLTLFVVDHAGPAGDSIHLSFEYSTELLRASTAQEWIRILARFCEAAVPVEEAAHA